jgi:Cys-tRNA(Pro)/Cys-tRNA(Cys) deacylase
MLGAGPADGHSDIIAAAEVPSSTPESRVPDSPQSQECQGTQQDRESPAGCPTPVEVLTALGVPFTLHEHVPIRTQTDIERELGLPVELLLKTMVFHTGEGLVLAALPITRRVHYGRLAKALGVPRSRLRQAEPGELAELAMEPGGASPVCGRDGVVTVFDESVRAMDRVYCGSGRADLTVELDAKELLRVLDPLTAELTSG